MKLKIILGVVSAVSFHYCTCCLSSGRSSSPAQTSAPSIQPSTVATPRKGFNLTGNDTIYDYTLFNFMNSENSDFTPPQDCADVQRIYGNRTSGIYTVRRPECFDTRRCSLDVLCDLETDGGGWTVRTSSHNFKIIMILENNSNWKKHLKN